MPPPTYEPFEHHNTRERATDERGSAGNTFVTPYAFDRELAPLVAALDAVDLSDVAAERARYQRALQAAGPQPRVDGVMVEIQELVGVDGSALSFRVFRPTLSSHAPLPGVLYIAGGGFVLGTQRSADRDCARMAEDLSAVVVQADYRLAPEHPFPAALLDCWSTLLWMAGTAAADTDVRVDVDRLALVGDSAGAALAAGLSLMARDRNGPRIRFIFLGIPVLDDSLRTDSMKRFSDTPLWDSRNAALSWQHYLRTGTVVDGEDWHDYAAPGTAADLGRLPATHIATAEFDPARDEGIEFGLRLLAAGVSVELHQYPGTFHGSGQLRADVSKRMRKDRIGALRDALHNPSTNLHRNSGLEPAHG